MIEVIQKGTKHFVQNAYGDGGVVFDFEYKFGVLKNIIIWTLIFLLAYYPLEFSIESSFVSCAFGIGSFFCVSILRHYSSFFLVYVLHEGSPQFQEAFEDKDEKMVYKYLGTWLVLHVFFPFYRKPFYQNSLVGLLVASMAYSLNMLYITVPFMLISLLFALETARVRAYIPKEEENDG